MEVLLPIHRPFAARLCWELGTVATEIRPCSVFLIPSTPAIPTHCLVAAFFIPSASLLILCQKEPRLWESYKSTEFTFKLNLHDLNINLVLCKLVWLSFKIRFPRSWLKRCCQIEPCFPLCPSTFRSPEPSRHHAISWAQVH